MLSSFWRDFTDDFNEYWVVGSNEMALVLCYMSLTNNFNTHNEAITQLAFQSCMRVLKNTCM